MVVVAKATKIDKRSLRDGIFGREKGEGGRAGSPQQSQKLNTLHPALLLENTALKVRLDANIDGFDGRAPQKQRKYQATPASLKQSAQSLFVLAQIYFIPWLYHVH